MQASAWYRDLKRGPLGYEAGRYPLSVACIGTMLGVEVAFSKVWVWELLFVRVCFEPHPPHPLVGTKEVLEAPSPSADRQRGESIVTLLSAVNGGL
jgi:hypothetical protein